MRLFFISKEAYGTDPWAPPTLTLGVKDNKSLPGNINGFVYLPNGSFFCRTNTVINGSYRKMT